MLWGPGHMAKELSAQAFQVFPDHENHGNQNHLTKEHEVSVLAETTGSKSGPRC